MKTWLLSQTSDASLVRKALAERPAAFEALVFRYQKKAHAVAWASGASRGSVEDAVQEAFLRAFQNLPQLRSPERFGPWLLQIVRNTARQYIARRGAAPPAPAEPLAAPESAAFDERELKESLWRAVGELPEGIREAVFLYYHEGEAVRAVARSLGISRSAALKRLQRGRDLLRESLWVELGDVLRDTLPSAREWVRKGRQLTILVAGGAAASWGVKASASPLAAGGAGKLILGGIEMAEITGKKLVLAFTLAVCVLTVAGGLVFTLNMASRHGESERRLATGTGDGGDRLRAPENSPAEAEGALLRAERIDGREAPATAAARPSLSGRITARDGNGVARAEVIAINAARWDAVLHEGAARLWNGREGDLAGELGTIFASYRRLAADLPRATTDPGGAYSFFGLVEGEYRLLARHDDYLPGEGRSVDILRDQSARVDLELIEGSSIRGSIRDQQGEPVAGAAVTCRPSAERALAAAERKDRLLGSWVEGRFLVERPVVESGAGGTYRLGSLEPALYDISVRKRGHADVLLLDVPAGGDGVNVTLTRGFSLGGRVLSTKGKPLAGAEVMLSAQALEKPRPVAVAQGMLPMLSADPAFDLGSPITAATGADGRFEIPGLGRGPYELRIGAAGHLALEREIEIEQDSDLGDVGLMLPLTIGGKTVDAGRRPVEGAVIWVEKPERTGVPAWGGRLFERSVLLETTSGPGGEFLLEGLGEGAYTLRASSPDHVVTVVPSIDAGTSKLEIVLAEGVSIRGIVADATSGEPLARAEVTLGTGLEASPVRGTTVKTAADGAFELGGVPRDRERTWLRVRHADYPGPPRVVDIESLDPRQAARILLFPRERIAGRVSDARGDPVAGARVALALGASFAARELGPGIRAVRSANDGSFILEVPGSLRASGQAVEIAASHALHGAGRSGTLPAPAEGAPWADAEIVLGAGSSLRGKILDAAGAPIARASVRATRQSGDSRGAVSDAGGAYEIARLEPGTYGVEVRAIGFARGVFPGVDVGDNAVERDFALSPGVSIEGMAVDDSGAPLEGAEVVVLKTEEWDRTSSAETRSARRHRRDNASGFACARTDARGRYLLTQLPEEDVTLVARAPGHEPSELLVVRPGEPPAELTLARLVSLSGTVRDGESGRAVSLFNVILKGDRGEDSRRTMGGEEQFLPREFDEPVGAFLIEGIAPGPYLLAVGAPGYAIWSGEITIPGEGAEVKVSLERGRTLQGRVVEAETGAPIVGARIICQARGWSWFYVGGMPLGSSRDDGTFSIGGLLEGTYSVYVHSSGYAPEPESVRVVISETDPEPLRLAMRGAGRLQVTIEGYDPARSVEAFVCLKRMEGEKTRELTYGLGRDGRAEAGAVPPGVYEAELKELVADPSLDLTRAGTSFRYEDLSEKRTPLGQVEVRAGEKATLETRLP